MSEWNYCVSAVATKRMNSDKRKTVKTIPLTEDLVTFCNFIVCSMTETIDEVKKSSYGKDWNWLAKLTLCRLILFNKRRPAEVKDVKLFDYISRPRWKDDESGEMRMAMSETDKLLAARSVDPK
jgi:hypothetical protein